MLKVIVGNKTDLLEQDSSKKKDKSKDRDKDIRSSNERLHPSTTGSSIDLKECVT